MVLVDKDGGITIKCTAMKRTPPGIVMSYTSEGVGHGTWANGCIYMYSTFNDRGWGLEMRPYKMTSQLHGPPKGESSETDDVGEWAFREYPFKWGVAILHTCIRNY